MSSRRQRLKATLNPASKLAPVQSQSLLSLLTAKQRAFVTDPHRYKVARCSRRAGKTFMIAAYMIHECLANKDTPVLYAGLTRDSAREAVWPILVDLLEQLDIPHKLHPSALQITFPNRSKITVFGCDTENARNRLRGRKFRLVCFDETGFYGALDALVYAVLPMLADFKGTLCLTSSPGELLEGLFYEADQGLRKESWSRYFWNIHDNPHFQSPADDSRFNTRAEEELWTVLQLQYQGNASHPGYRREWLGEWVADHTALCYPVSDINLVDTIYKMPSQRHAIGIFLSPFVNALVVGRYSEYSRECQIVESREFEDMDLDDFAKVVNSAVDTYRPDCLVTDTGIYSKDVVLELRKRYQLPVSFIDDKDKSFHQKIFANDLKAGHIKIKRTLNIVAKFAKIVKDATTGEEIKGQPNYSPNAALALYRRIYQTTLSSYTPPLTEEERHLEQLLNSRNVDVTPWTDRTY
jgi:hypothetical protein